MLRLDIKTLERYSGVKAHTIRAWEQRFKVFEPSRTAGNRRFYHSGDLKVLLDFSILNRYGTPISKLLQLSKADIESRITQLRTTAAAKDVCLNQLIVNFVDSEIMAFERVLWDYTALRGPHECVTDLILPFIEDTGLFYYLNQDSSIHFVVTSIRKKLHFASDSLIPVNRHQPTVLLFLPANQHFDLLLLYISYMLQAEGYNVLYLGTNVSVEILRKVAERYQPRLLISYLVPIGKSYADDVKNLTAIASFNENLLVCTADEVQRSTDGLTTVPYCKIVPYLKSCVNF